jgi:hypothetical protein
MNAGPASLWQGRPTAVIKIVLKIWFFIAMDTIKYSMVFCSNFYIIQIPLYYHVSSLFQVLKASLGW